MCGRARSSAPAPQVASAVGVPIDRFRDSTNYVPMVNAYPGVYLPVMYQDDDGKISLRPMAWGLVPSFTKREGPINHVFCFNARSESVAEKSVFKRLLNRRRCVVIVDGFYEWRLEDGKKRPYFVQPTGRPLLLAALYDVYYPSEQQQEKLAATVLKRQQAYSVSQGWTVHPAPHSGSGSGAGMPEDREEEEAGGAGGQETVDGGQHSSHAEGDSAQHSSGVEPHGHGIPPLYSVSILTCPPCGSLAWLHDRMPCILPTMQQAQAWMDCVGNPWELVKAEGGSAGQRSTFAPPRALLLPYAGSDLQWHPCSRKMNTLTYQHVDASEAVDPEAHDAEEGSRSKRGKNGAATPSPGKGQGTLLAFLQGGGKARAAGAGADHSKLAEATGQLGAASSASGASAGRKRSREDSAGEDRQGSRTGAQANPSQQGRGHQEEEEEEEVVELLE